MVIAVGIVHISVCSDAAQGIPLYGIHAPFYIELLCIHFVGGSPYQVVDTSYFTAAKIGNF